MLHACPALPHVGDDDLQTCAKQNSPAEQVEQAPPPEPQVSLVMPSLHALIVFVGSQHPVGHVVALHVVLHNPPVQVRPAQHALLAPHDCNELRHVGRQSAALAPQLAPSEQQTGWALSQQLPAPAPVQAIGVSVGHPFASVPEQIPPIHVKVVPQQSAVVAHACPVLRHEGDGGAPHPKQPSTVAASKIDRIVSMRLPPLLVAVSSPPRVGHLQSFETIAL